MSLSALNSAPPAEDFDDRDEAPTAAAKPAAEAAGGKIRMGLGGLSNSTAAASASIPEDDGDLGNLAEVLGGAEASEPAAASPGGIEDAILSALPDGDASEIGAADASEASSEAGGDDPSVEDVLNPEDAPVEQIVAGLTGNRHDAINPNIAILAQMLQLQRGEAEAQQMAVEFLNACAENEAQSKAIDETEAQARERLAAMNEESVQQVGGGFLSSLLSRIVPKNDEAMRQIDGIGRERRRLRDDYMGQAKNFGDRVASNLSRDLDKRILRSYTAMEDVAKSVNDYNATVLGADAAKEVRAAAQAYAEASGKPLHEVASEIGAGKAPKDLLDAFSAAEAEIRADEGVRKAKAEMQRAQASLAEQTKGIKDRIEVLLKNGDEKIPETHHKFMDGIEDHIAKCPHPMDDPAEAEEFKKRLREMFESIRNAVEKFIGGLTSAFAR